jgi:hypothetical protein
VTRRERDAVKQIQKRFLCIHYLAPVLKRAGVWTETEREKARREYQLLRDSERSKDAWLKGGRVDSVGRKRAHVAWYGSGFDGTYQSTTIGSSSDLFSSSLGC